MTLDLVNYVNMDIEKTVELQNVQTAKQYRKTAPCSVAKNHMNFRR